MVAVVRATMARHPCNDYPAHLLQATMLLVLLFVGLLSIGHYDQRGRSRDGHPWRRFGRKTTVNRKPLRGRRKPNWVKERLVRMKAHTDLSCHKLADTFNRQYAERAMTVGKTFVAEVIKTHRYEIAQLRKRWKRNIPKPQPRNTVWGVDMTGKGDAHGDIHPILGVIDHGSRMALAMHPLRDRAALTLLKALIAAIEICGKPKVIRTDNEACFTSRVFRLGLTLLRVRHQRSQPGCPWQNGRVERLFGTLKEKLDQLWVLDGIGLQQALSEFRFWYNQVRSHQHLDGWTPWEAWHGAAPYQAAPTSVELFIAWDGLLTGYYMRR